MMIHADRVLCCLEIFNCLAQTFFVTHIQSNKQIILFFFIIGSQYSLCPLQYPVDLRYGFQTDICLYPGIIITDIKPQAHT